MSWITIIWSMTAAACLTLALIHFLVWCRQRGAWANLSFAVAAVSTAVLAGFELALMHAETPAAFGGWLRWGHVPVVVTIVALTVFVRLYLRAGRLWLGWAACLVRSLALFPNFLSGENLNYREITSLRRISFFGEPVTLAVGVPNPWMLLSQAGLLLMIWFVADATRTAWQRGDKRQALVVGGSILFLLMFGTVQAVLVFWGERTLRSLPVFFAAIVAAMGLKLSRDVLHAADLAREVRVQEQRLGLIAAATHLGLWILEFGRAEIWASHELRMLFGFTSSERLDPDRFLRQLHPDDRERLRQTLADVQAGVGQLELEFRVVRPDGSGPLDRLARPGGLRR